MKKLKWLSLTVSLVLLLSVVLSSCAGTTTVTSTSSTTLTSTTTQVSTTTQPTTITTTQVSTTTQPTTITTTSTTTNTTTVPTTLTTTKTTTTTSTTAIPMANSLTGAGGTFPQPLYAKWFDVYNTQFGVQINYQGVGSGAGITQITAGTVDFGASDGIMTDTQVAAATAAFGPILHIPTTDGAVAVIYNIPGVTGQLNLTGDVLANIYLKVIKTWNDPAITALNPGVNLPNTAIAVVHRSDSSGTSNIFTNYLDKVSTQWHTQLGYGNSVAWPPGDIGGEKNAGVAAQVQQIPGAIGYVELAYALQNNLLYAKLKNASGNYVSPTLASTAAAASGITLPDDMKIMITNSANANAYPIVGFTWILAYQNQANQAKGEAVVKMLWWAIHDGQQYCAALNYATLSADAVTKAENEILSIQYKGQPLLTR